MQFDHSRGPGQLVQTIDVLSCDADSAALSFQLGNDPVSPIGRLSAEASLQLKKIPPGQFGIVSKAGTGEGLLERDSLISQSLREGSRAPTESGNS